jgi:phosphinothricin acetyltransferase
MPSDVTIRPAEEGDLPAITAIYDEAVRAGTASYELDPPDLAEMIRRWRSLVANDFPYLAAIRGGELIGYAYAGPFRPRPAYRFSVEDSLYIAPDAQRGGVGRMLLIELIARCEEKGFRQMIAVIGDGSEGSGSVKLHRALGFHDVGVFEAAGFKFGRWLDTMLMQRPLGPGRSTLPVER